MTFDYMPNEHRLSRFAARKINEIGKSLNPQMMTAPSPRVEPWSVVPYQSTHNTGGTIMGTNPSNSVVNKYCQSWDAHNLFIMGASLFPITLLTILLVLLEQLAIGLQMLLRLDTLKIQDCLFR
jgi:gluconate 2-dehydrogenase alpha chain